jgi:hypothetical protein
MSPLWLIQSYIGFLKNTFCTKRNQLNEQKTFNEFEVKQKYLVYYLNNFK